MLKLGVISEIKILLFFVVSNQFGFSGISIFFRHFGTPN